jgi:hypothetical protein
MLVEEPLHLYQRNGLLKACLTMGENTEDVFQVSATHLLHIHLLNVIEFAISAKVNIIIMERHLETVKRTFAEGVIDRYPAVEMNLLTGYQVAVEDITARFHNNLKDQKILHGCIFVNWASLETLTANIIKRGREMEIKLITDGTYRVNNWLDKKYKHMLEIINVPIYMVTDKFGDGNDIEHLKHDIDTYIKHI